MFLDIEEVSTYFRSKVGLYYLGEVNNSLPRNCFNSGAYVNIVIFKARSGKGGLQLKLGA